MFFWVASPLHEIRLPCVSQCFLVKILVVGVTCEFPKNGASLSCKFWDIVGLLQGSKSLKKGSRGLLAPGQQNSKKSWQAAPGQSPFSDFVSEFSRERPF